MSEVTLHVYEAVAPYLSFAYNMFGKPVYYTSVQVGDTLYTYRKKDGITCDEVSQMKRNRGGDWKESIRMGKSIEAPDSIERWQQEKRVTFARGTYDAKSHNENTFSDSFLQFLVGKGVPDRILRPFRLENVIFGDAVGGGASESSTRLTAESFQPCGAESHRHATTIQKTGRELSQGSRDCPAETELHKSDPAESKRLDRLEILMALLLVIVILQPLIKWL